MTTAARQADALRAGTMLLASCAAEQGDEPTPDTARTAETTDGGRHGLHDHANEQPVTRGLDGLDLPEDVDELIVEGRDLEHGWGGATVSVAIPGR